MSSPRLTPVESPSVVGLAYEKLRTLILSGQLEPGARLGQVELAAQLQISRTPVREALRRLTGEGLVDALPNRGFRVADLGLDAVMRRLEIRALLEPGVARLAAARATPGDIAALRAHIRDETRARSAKAAHDASRGFHITLAAATGNPDLEAVLAAQWIVEVGQRLLARRAAEPEWRDSDVAEHAAITDAVEAGDGELAATLMTAHVEAALRHWEAEREQTPAASPLAAAD